MKAIVTGAAGFIGCNASRHLADRGWTVVGVDNLSRRGSAINLEWLQEQCRGNWHFQHVDVRNKPDVSRVFQRHRDARLVLHAAAQVAVTTSVSDPLTDFDINATGTFNVLEAVRTFCPEALMIYPSTNKVYGELQGMDVKETAGRYAFTNGGTGVDEEQGLDFHSPYGCSKGSADQYVHDYQRIYGLDTVVCRQSCIYGVRQLGVEDQGWVAWFLIAALRKLPITIYGTGKQVRDLLWVEDLVNLYEALYHHRDVVSGHVYNVGGGIANTLSLLELLDMIEEFNGCPPQSEFADWRPGDQKIYVSDITAVSKDAEWVPRIGVNEGVELLYNWLKANVDVVQKALALPLGH